MEENKSNGYFKGLLTGVILGAMVVLLVFTVTQLNDGITDNIDTLDYSDDTDISNLSEKMQLVISEIDKLYIDEIDEEELENAVCKGILESLGDPYSCYYDEEELASMLEGVTGTYCGIGVAVAQNIETKEIIVTTAFKSGSAYEAGIKPGDILIGVDGKSVEDNDLDTVVSWVKGEEGTEVTVQILRDGKEMEFTMDRRIIKIDTVFYKMLDDNIGYIQLTEFDEVSITQFSDAVEDLKSQGMEKVIVDIRDNPGGRMDVVCDLVNTFLEKDKLILYTEDKYGEREEQHTLKDGTLMGMPLVVLVNGNSASASEVFSGVVKDYEVGTVVGTQTFGKGIVQRLVRLSDGTALKLTYSKYYTPSGVDIHGKGIEPNEVVELPDDKESPTLLEEGEEDTQLQRAIEILK